MKAYHISPDKGVGIFTLNNQNNLEKHLPNMKSFFKDYEDWFSCKNTIDAGISNSKLFYQADLK